MRLQKLREENWRKRARVDAPQNRRGTAALRGGTDCTNKKDADHESEPLISSGVLEHTEGHS